jgi:hypothetical protein
MKVVCFTIVLDDCHVLAQELEEKIRARLQMHQMKEVDVAAGYYPLQRIVKVSSLERMEEVMGILTEIFW